MSLNVNARAFVPSFGGGSAAAATTASPNGDTEAQQQQQRNTPGAETSTTPSAPNAATAAAVASSVPDVEPLKHLYHIMYNDTTATSTTSSTTGTTAATAAGAATTATTTGAAAPSSASSSNQRPLSCVLKSVSTPLPQYTPEYFAQHQKQQMGATQKTSGMMVEGFIVSRAPFDLSQPASGRPAKPPPTSANATVAPLGGFLIPLYVTPDSGAQHAEKLSTLSATLDYGWQDMMTSFAYDSRVSAMGHLIKKFAGPKQTFHYFFVCIDFSIPYFCTKQNSQSSPDMGKESILQKCRLARRGVPIARNLLHRCVIDCTVTTSWAVGALCVVTEDPALTYSGGNSPTKPDPAATATSSGTGSEQQVGASAGASAEPAVASPPLLIKSSNEGGGGQAETQEAAATTQQQQSTTCFAAKTVHIRVPVPRSAAGISYAALEVLQAIEDNVLTVQGNDAWEISGSGGEQEEEGEEKEKEGEGKNAPAKSSSSSCNKRDGVAVILELRQSVGEDVTHVCNSYAALLLRLCIDCMLPVVSVAGYLPDCMAVPGALPRWIPNVDELLLCGGASSASSVAVEAPPSSSKSAATSQKPSSSSSSPVPPSVDGAHSWWCRQALAPRMVAAFDWNVCGPNTEKMHLKAANKSEEQQKTAGTNSGNAATLASSSNILACVRSMQGMYNHAASVLSRAIFGGATPPSSSLSLAQQQQQQQPLFHLKVHHPYLLNRVDHPFPLPSLYFEAVDYVEEITLIREYVLSHLGHTPNPSTGVVTVRRPPTQRLARSSFVDSVMPFAKEQYLFTPTPKGIDVFLVVDAQGTVYVTDTELQSVCTIICPESSYWQGENPLSAFPGTILKGVVATCSAQFGTPTDLTAAPCKIVVQDVLVVMDANLTAEAFDARWRTNVMGAMNLEDARSNAHFVPAHGLSIVRANYFTQREVKALLAGNELQCSKSGYSEQGITAVPLNGTYFPLPEERVDPAHPSPPSVRYTWRTPDSATAVFAIGSVTPLGGGGGTVKKKEKKEADEAQPGKQQGDEQEQQTAAENGDEGPIAARATLCVRFQNTHFLEPYNGEFADFYVPSARNVEAGQVVECLLRRHDAGAHWWEILREFSGPSEYLVTPMSRKAVTTEVIDPYLSVSELAWLTECSKYLCHQCGSVNDQGRCDNSNGRYYCVSCWELYGEGHCAQCAAPPPSAGANSAATSGQQQQQHPPPPPVPVQRRLLQSGLPMVKGATDKTPIGGCFYCHGCWAVFMLKPPNNVTWAKPRHVQHYVAYCSGSDNVCPDGNSNKTLESKQQQQQGNEQNSSSTRAMNWIDVLRGTEYRYGLAQQLQLQQQQAAKEQKKEDEEEKDHPAPPPALTIAALFSQSEQHETRFTRLLEIAKGYFLYAVTMTAPCSIALDLCAGEGDSLPAIALLTSATRYIGVDVQSKSLQTAAARSAAVASDATTNKTGGAATLPSGGNRVARVPASFHGSLLCSPGGSTAATSASAAGAASSAPGSAPTTSTATVPLNVPPGTVPPKLTPAQQQQQQQQQNQVPSLQQCTFLPGDCFCSDFYTKHLPRAYGLGKKVHLVTCFDGLHNAFSSAETLKTALRGIASVMSPNGIFVGFVLDAAKLSQLGANYQNDALKIEWKPSPSQQQQQEEQQQASTSPSDQLVRIGNRVHIRVQSSPVPSSVQSSDGDQQQQQQQQAEQSRHRHWEPTQFVQNVVGLDVLKAAAAECNLTYDASWSVPLEEVPSALPPLLKAALAQQTSQPGANSATLQEALREAQARGQQLQGVLSEALAGLQSNQQFGHLLAAWNVFVFRKVAMMNAHHQRGAAVAAAATVQHT